ncbi:hypothetical protein AB0J20_18290 [Micromonospora costi]|uniref:hypothetical protein n=1 Tax=Micromonospora costi TaxID=1530042 RepID=UPI0033FD02CC
MCTGGVHRGEPVHIRENLTAVLRQRGNLPPLIALEFWNDPADAEPAELIQLDMTDAARLSVVLNRLAALAGGIR